MIKYAVWIAIACVAGCSTTTPGSSQVCSSTSNAGPCTGTFPCGNSGISGACDKATQICVVGPGSVNCATITGASASSCPTEADADGVAGCTTPFVATCSGSPADGITVMCEQSH